MSPATGPTADEEFALLRFTAVLAAPEVALVEVEGRLGATLQARRGLPRLLLEDGGGRIELAAVPGASVVHDDVLRVTFAAPAEVSDAARWTLALRDLLVELPTPDVPPGPERHVALARELNEVRHRLRIAEEVVDAADADREAARAEGIASVQQRLTAAEEARVAAEARTAELQAAASARDGELREEGATRVRAARAELAGRVAELEDEVRAADERADARVEAERQDAAQASRALEERSGRADERVAEAVRGRDAAQAEAVAARARAREATRLLKLTRDELAAAGAASDGPTQRARAAASPLGATTAAARSEQEAQDDEDERLDDADPTATAAFDALAEEAPAAAEADDTEDTDEHDERDDTYETAAIAPPRDTDGRKGWGAVESGGQSDTVRVLGRDRPRASALPPPPDADVLPPPFLARWGAPIALGVALLILLIIVISAVL